MNRSKLVDMTAIPRNFGSCIYVAELNSGVVKVGFSASPRNRISSVDAFSRKVYGARVTRFHISQKLELRQAQGCEKKLIEKMKIAGTQLKGRIEYFHGVTFDDAVLAAMDAAKTGETANPGIETVKAFAPYIDRQPEKAV